MIEIKNNKQLAAAVNAAYDFDKKHGECADESTGQFTANFYHETYTFAGKTRAYYFDNSKLFGYEDK